jgi:AcrR family transcriptional regulator
MGQMVETTGAATKKLPRAERREQLLETAQTIIREKGTDALTLGHVAECAGVSKPIAYEHFGTRAGLLIALCNDYDLKQKQARSEVLGKDDETLAGAIAVMASAYVSCVLGMGPEMGAAFAALSATEETADFRRSLREGYVAEYRKAFGRFVKLPENDDAIFLGFLGAAEALAQDAAAGRVSPDEAVEALSRIFTGTLERYEVSG